MKSDREVFLDGYNDIIKTVSSSPYVIYGAGSFGKRFLGCMQRMGLDACFKGFAVTKADETQKDLVSIESVDRSTYIVIASHNESAKEMERLVRELGFEKYVLLFPYLQEFELGLPIRYDETIDVEALVEKLSRRFSNNMTVYLLAMDSTMQDNISGKELYIRLMDALSSSHETSVKRYEQLKLRCMAYSKGDHSREDYNIKVNSDKNLVVDGLHRLMMAYYFGRKELKADIYNFDENDKALSRFVYVNDHTDEFFTEGQVKVIKAGFDKYGCYKGGKQ